MAARGPAREFLGFVGNSSTRTNGSNSIPTHSLPKLTETAPQDSGAGTHLDACTASWLAGYGATRATGEPIRNYSGACYGTRGLGWLACIAPRWLDLG